MKEILFDMLSHYGLSEIDGPLNNEHILEFFKEIGYDWVKDENTSWCAACVNYFAKKNGYVGSGKLDARSFLKVGEAVDKPETGDVIVLWRESKSSWKGHVGLYISENEKFVYVLGGNQSGDQVNISMYSKTRVLGYRRLAKI